MMGVKRRRTGFSMIELLLVLVIILLTTTLAIPSFIKSFRSARLRTSARTVVMTHRHARSMAVLQQKQVALLFDVSGEEPKLEVVSINNGQDTAGRDAFMDQRDTIQVTDGEAPEPDAPAVSVESELVRFLEPNIRIDNFVSGNEDQEYDGIYWMNYYPNGMCDGYRLRLTDEKDRAVEITVSALSGNVTVEKD